jgi:glutamyl-tRNA reductase
MNAAGSIEARLLVVGTNHRSSPAAFRDRVFIAEAEMPMFLAELRRAGIDQAIVMSTCDRIEIQALHAHPVETTTRLAAILSTRAGVSASALRQEIYALQGAEALRHVFAVASALDSQVVGEPQVLGQVKEALKRAQGAAMSGPELDTLMQAIFGAAKRVRSETAVGQRPVTLASAAVQLARDVHGDLARCRALLLGTGEMGELMAEHLRGAGIANLAVGAPVAARAEEIARRLSCHVTPFDDLPPALAASDIVVTAAGTGRFVITPDMVNEAMRRRRRRPLFFIDLGVPVDVDPAVEKIDDVFRYNIDDLERATMSGRAAREAAAAEAWTIVEAEVAAFLRDRAERAAVPTIAALRRHFEAARERALREANGDAARATELLINRLLHGPYQALREIAAADAEGADDQQRAERLLAKLFGLDESDKETKA